MISLSNFTLLSDTQQIIQSLPYIIYSVAKTQQKSNKPQKLLPIFIIDSGASISMCYQRNLFTNLSYVHIPIKLGDGNVIYALGRGTVANLKDIYYVPDLKFNLLSVSYLTNLGFIVSFLPSGSVTITDKYGNLHQLGFYENGIYRTYDNILDFNDDEIHGFVTTLVTSNALTSIALRRIS